MRKPTLNSNVRHVSVTASGHTIGHSEPYNAPLRSRGSQRSDEIAERTGSHTSDDKRSVAMPASGSGYFPAQRQRSY